MSFGPASPDAGVELLRQLFLQCMFLTKPNHFTTVIRSRFLNKPNHYKSWAAPHSLTKPNHYNYELLQCPLPDETALILCLLPNQTIENCELYQYSFLKKNLTVSCSVSHQAKQERIVSPLSFLPSFFHIQEEMALKVLSSEMDLAESRFFR